MSLVLNKKKFVPSPQQSTLFTWVTDGAGSCVLEAVAGSGKTTTLIKALELMFGSIFFGAYNKKIAEEIKSRAPSKDGLNVATMHAAGFAAWRKVTNRVNLDGDKVRNIFRAAVFRNMQYAPFQGPVVQLVSLAKQAGVGIDGFPAIESRSTWQDLIDHFDIETFDEASDVDNSEIIIKLARKTLEASIQQNLELIDFDDMIYAPLYHNCSIDKYDWVLVDEAQDTNATRRELALRMMKPNGRMIAVGDRHQAIYGFTGADSDALDLIATAVDAKQLPLTVTYRCPKAVVAYAQQWVSHIQAADTAPEGIVRHAPLDTLHTEVQVGDAILCRFNAPLVTNVYKLIAKGVPAKIEGREIGNGLKTLANKWKVKSIDTLIARLDKYEEREVAKYEAKEQLVKVVAIKDKVGCLRIIIDRVIAVDPHTKTPAARICTEVDAIFGDNGDAPVVLLSSIHKSKGREWKKVVWLQAKPNGRARLDWQIVQENNLNYVAATRAMHELVLVDITDENKEAKK
jgi:superfamily I DNA/RNA helicase